LELNTKSTDLELNKNLDKRHRLEDKMNEVLGWTGLGIPMAGSLESEQWKLAV